MKIEVLGTGCAKCKKLERLVQTVVAELGVDAEITKVERVESRMGAVKVSVAGPNGPEVIEGTHILVATGRKRRR